MIGLALASLMVGVVILVVPHVTWLWLVLGLAFGAGLLPAYAIAASHVFDFADRSDYVEISAGLLLLNGLGSTVGPLLTSLAIELFGPSGMFITNGVVMMVLIGFVAVRLSRREGLPEEEKENFDWGTAGAVSVVGDEEAVQLSDLVVQESDLVVQEPAA